MPATKKLILTEEERKTLTGRVNGMHRRATRDVGRLTEARKRQASSKRLKDLLDAEKPLTKAQAEDLRMILKRGDFTEVESIFTKLVKLGW